MLGPKASTEAVEALRASLGLNDPLYVQYGKYLLNLLRLDMGFSLVTHRPVVQEMLARFPATIELCMAAMIVSLAIGLPTGTISAVKENSVVDHLCRIAALIGISWSAFWFALILQLAFAITLGLLPISGSISPLVDLRQITGSRVLDSILTGNMPALASSVMHLILPGLTLGASSAALTSRMLRASMLDVLQEDYIRTAYSKGLSTWSVITKHALKNALIPTATVIGLQAAYLMGGSVVVETVFAWPGIGRFLFESVMSRDFPMVQCIVLSYAFVVVIANLLVDISYVFLDPRIRYDERRA
jgi:peptide/nickel transport system permease protein